MGVSIIVNNRVYITEDTRKILVIEGIDIDAKKVMFISVEIGRYKGFKVAEYLRYMSANDMCATEWVFGQDEAETLIQEIKDSSEDPESEGLSEEDITELKYLAGDLSTCIDDSIEQRKIFFCGNFEVILVF